MPTHKDRRTALLVAGIIEILLGGLCLMGMLFAGLGVAMAGAQQGGPSLRLMVPGLIFYLMAAGFWVTMGIGSIRARRWARALMVVVSWMWLITGLLALVILFVTLPRMFGLMAQGNAPVESIMVMIMIFMGFFYGFLLVVLPLVFLLFYRSPNVQATCEAAHPQPCWTDRCPLPVLALSVILVYGALSLLMSLPISVLPVFGRFVTGVPAALAFILLAATWGWLAYAVYRLKIAGWWATLFFICLGSVSAWITFAHADLQQLYRVMGMDEAQLEMLETMDFTRWMPWQIGVGSALFLAYALFVRRYFRDQTGTART